MCGRKLVTYDEKEGIHQLLCDGKGSYLDFLDATTSGKNYIYISDLAMDAIVRNSVSGINERFCCKAISGKTEHFYHKCDITGIIAHEAERKVALVSAGKKEIEAELKKPESGFVSLRDNAMRLVMEGVTTSEELLRVVSEED